MISGKPDVPYEDEETKALRAEILRRNNIGS